MSFLNSPVFKLALCKGILAKLWGLGFSQLNLEQIKELASSRVTVKSLKKDSKEPNKKR